MFDYLPKSTSKRNTFIILYPQTIFDTIHQITYILQGFPYSICRLNKANRSSEISRKQIQKLTSQFFVIYILDIDSHCPQWPIYYLGKTHSI